MGALISVVVPIYNVEPYLAQCLKSVARQSHADLQVVMVDDGSSDGSARIAKGFVDTDERFLLIQQPNRGLGAARNAGIDRATGEFLAFLDSDDLLPQEAYALLLASLRGSGSDFAAGVVRRFGSFGSRRTNLTPFRRSIRRTHIQHDDGLLMDRIVTNKLWRRSFWDRHGLRFPEGVLYEDVLVAFSAQVAAEAVDVLRDTVYWWRERNASITHNRVSPYGVKDRVEAISAVGQFMNARGFPELKRRYERVALATELQQFVDVADRGTSEYRRALATHVGDYVAGLDSQVLDALPAILRLKYHLTERGFTDELLDVLAFQRTALRDAATKGSGEERYGVYPFFEDRRVQIPPEVYRLRTELQARCAIHSLHWSGQTLHLRGYAYINLVGAGGRRHVDTTLVVRNRKTGAETSIPTQSILDPQATLHAGHGAYRYDGAGFKANIDTSMLGIPPEHDATFEVEAVVRSGGIERRSTVWRRTSMAVERAGRATLPGGRTIRTSFEADVFTLRVEQVQAVVTRLRVGEDSLVIRGYLVDKTLSPKSLYVRRRVGATPYKPPVYTADNAGTGRREFRTKLALSKLAERADAARAGAIAEPGDDDLGGDVVWQVRMRLEDDSDIRMVVSKRVPATGLVHGDREFTLHRTRHRNLGVTERRLRPVVTGAQWRGATLVLTGEQARDDTPANIVLKRRATGHERTVPVKSNGRSVVITLPLDSLLDAGEPRPLPQGTWDVLVEKNHNAATRVPLRAHVDALDDLESHQVQDGRRYELQDVGYGGLAIRVSPGRPKPRWQELRDQSRPVRRTWRAPRPRLVVFSSWQGRRYAGDVRAIYEALATAADMQAVWVCDDAQFAVSQGRVVEVGSRPHVEALSRASVVVTDHLLPPWWRKTPGQRVLQTWHGTPVRRGALALPDDMRRAAHWCLEELRRQAPQWDVVTSATAAAAEITRRTTGFEGTIVEAGAARADIHHRPEERAARTAAVRRRLGLRPETKVVLWAPAARDEGWTGRRGQNPGVELHIPDMTTALPGDVVVLVHRHPAVARFVASTRHFQDVTGVHDVADLFLVADVLVSDYSSVILDFLHTAKPIVLYMPDLDAFVESGPGFAVDLLADPPGEVTRTSSEALSAVAQALASGATTPGYDALLALYGGPADGAVTNRLMQQFFT